MRATLLFFTGVDQIKLPRILGKGERFSERFYITGDKDWIAKIVSPLKAHIGLAEYSYLANECQILVHSEQEIQYESLKELDDAMKSYLIGELMQIQEFLQRLWIIQDNAGLQDRGWLSANLGGNHIVHNNVWNVRHSNADGSYDVKEFTRDQIKTARLSAIYNAKHSYEGGIPTPLVNKTIRIERFLYFMQIARASPDVAMKIVHYCSGLESLVSSSSTELTHQIAERVACLLEDPGNGRLDCFGKIKKAYALRSRAVHGGNFKSSRIDEIKATSIYLDNVCRRLIEIYLTNKGDISAHLEDDPDRFDSFFNRKILCSDSSIS